MSREVTFPSLGTQLLSTTYDGLFDFCRDLATKPAVSALEFSNTQIVTMRRHEEHFRKLTSKVDFFIPDGMPLIWHMNWQGAKLEDRVYGPTFMRHCLLKSTSTTHYFLGGSPALLDRLTSRFKELNPQLQILGARGPFVSSEGRFAKEDEFIVEEINMLSPDFIWVGLGTPKQQGWVFHYKERIKRGVLLGVGFAFDVNAGMKKDAPEWMQPLGLTWVYRLLSEPRRLAGRYLKWNSLFLYYLALDAFWKPKRTNGM